ncbi:MAG: hypothetical protein ACXW38_08440 [Nitrospira sp.]
MQLKRIQSYILGLLLVVSLSACGGDGDIPTPPPVTASATSAEGHWTGTTDTNRTVKALVLDDGIYWALYSDASTPSIIAGVIQGDSSSQNGAFTSSNARDFNLQTGILEALINGTYAMKQNLNGTIVYQTGGQSTFTMTYNSDYDLTPDINAVAGTYTGFVTATETVTVVVSTTGTISGSSNTGCIFTGSFLPRAHGNVYDVTVTFGNQAGCSNRNETVTGIAFYEASAKRLLSAALNSTRTDGFVFIGTRP